MTKKIFINTFLIGASVLLLCAVIFFALQYTQTLDETYDALRGEAVYAASGLKLNGQKYLETLGSINRITWIDAGGGVIYDSEFPHTAVNQNSYPEVISARETGEGQGIRESLSGGENTMYYAFLCDDGTVLRLSRPLSAVRYALVAVSPVLWVFILVLLISGVIAFRVANQILKPVNELDLENPDASKTYAELAPLVSRLREQHLTINEQVHELLRSQREFSALTDSMAEGFVLIDKDGIILSANSAASFLAESGEIGSSLRFGNADADAAVNGALSNMRSETILAKDSQSWRLIANPVVSNGRVTGAVVLLLDVTEREQRERLRQEFSANVSHELKTPLTSISGFAELLMNGLVGEDKIKEFSGDIYKESRRMIALIDDIIKLSKLDEDAVSREFEEVDLYDAASSVLDDLRMQADKRDVTLVLTGGHVKISGVWRLIWEMIYNLCDNAIKYNKDGGSVEVDVRQENDRAVVTVADTGIGIPKSEQNRVFERFYRVDKSHSKEIGGTGLGLSIVKHGAQFHNARFELESKVGEGTKITLEFPKER